MVARPSLEAQNKFVSTYQFYGPKNWQRQVKGKLEAYFGRHTSPRNPVFSAGAMASSDRLVKDPELLMPWITAPRGILAIEMESAGVRNRSAKFR